MTANMQVRGGILSEPGTVVAAPALLDSCLRGTKMSDRTCSVEGCEKSPRTRGWCPMHYQRWLRYGDVHETQHPGIHSGRHQHGGYMHVRAPDHPLADSTGWVREHRYVMWEAGLLTDPTHHVHHKNHDKADNRIENLEVLTAQEHRQLHANEPETCKNGHLWTEETTFHRSNRNQRECRLCMLERGRARQSHRCPNGHPHDAVDSLGRGYCSVCKHGCVSASKAFETSHGCIPVEEKK